ncbi:copper transport outer membrane protein MctB [Kribbella orskensis]|uniref:Copper transport outer membrane protein MctB n=1 Tax=Kribbella orskensis TaxID=2512216 RepID=A0ABY2BAY0_9ACTN|nr:MULTISPECIES: copper transporter [Kribbella]TCN31594.1 copper transport outer membrane protein MctB [Kribbella sp. VKM Ac-2500]TCO11939.1 copper transport outer membrane protein MctB [Kribbella orskensis]
MIDFRYHIVSIVAIFFALGAGVVLGAGPLKGTGSEIVQSQADKDRAALEDARADLIQAKALDKYRDDYVAKVTAGLTDGKLTGKTIAVVTMPSADNDMTNSVQDAIEAAGGQVTTRVSLDAKLFDPGQRQLVESLVNELVTADITFDPDSNTYQRAGMLLARGIAAREEGKPVDTEATRILSGVTGSKLVSLKPTPKERASLVVVVAAKPPTPAPDNSSYNDAVDFAEGLDQGSGGAVVAGVPESAQNGGMLKSLRGDSAATKILSTVDVANIPSGQMTVVFALVEQASGKAGQYGAVDAKNGVAPSADQAKGN